MRKWFLIFTLALLALMVALWVMLDGWVFTQMLWRGPVHMTHSKDGRVDLNALIAKTDWQDYEYTAPDGSQAIVRAVSAIPESTCEDILATLAAAKKHTEDTFRAKLTLYVFEGKRPKNYVFYPEDLEPVSDIAFLDNPAEWSAEGRNLSARRIAVFGLLYESERRFLAPSDRDWSDWFAGGLAFFTALEFTRQHDFEVYSRLKAAYQPLLSLNHSGVHDRLFQGPNRVLLPALQAPTHGSNDLMGARAQLFQAAVDAKGPEVLSALSSAYLEAPDYSFSGLKALYKKHTGLDPDKAGLMDTEGQEAHYQEILFKIQDPETTDAEMKFLIRGLAFYGKHSQEFVPVLTDSLTNESPPSLVLAIETLVAHVGDAAQMNRLSERLDSVAWERDGHNYVVKPASRQPSRIFPWPDGDLRFVLN